MPTTPPTAESGRYLISSNDSASLAEFIRAASADPEIGVAETIGPRNQPHTVVVTLTPEKAVALEQQFRQSSPLKIEPDRPLSLFGDASGVPVAEENQHGQEP
ncbi:hypothetical protein RCH09_003018 [Actimicrobium sp. GrIS 1.19]|uniref:hypothetical protein n=1 Tax=Actimicrobium sp. GrIS 1.19 TaxID=3071708 RepID=UPI002E0805B4|nr:hypothetical protein [Actimicrobium sp. GrIS 1.19]